MLETSPDKQGRIFQLLISIVLVVVLMAFWLDSFERNEPVVTKEAVSASAFSFSRSLLMIRTEWQIQGRKPAVYFREYDVDGELVDERIIKVTSSGWAYENNSFNELDCDLVWQQVANTTMTIQNETVISEQLVVSANGVVGTGIADKRDVASAICRYHVGDELWFDYHLKSGQVLVAEASEFAN